MLCLSGLEALFFTIFLRFFTVFGVFEDFLGFLRIFGELKIQTKHLAGIGLREELETKTQVGADGNANL